MLTDGEKIAAAACKWLGARHINGQCTRYIATDCALMYLACLEDAGLVGRGEMYIRPYSGEWYLHHNEEKMLGYFTQLCKEVPIEEMRIGDALLYQFGRCIGHAGVYIGKGLIIHAVALEKAIIMSGLGEALLKDGRGRSRLRKVMRFSHDKYLANKGRLGDRRCADGTF